MLETIAGIPVHPLFVHAAVVAVPVAAIVAIVAAAALFLVTQTGHEGAMLVWKEG